MRITIGDNTRQAMKVIGIDDYPFSVKELSDKFRTLIKVYHPDVCKEEDAEKITKEIIKSYSILKNLALSDIDNGRREEAYRIFDEDEDMFSLWETCEHCNGRGKWNENVPTSKILCPDCNKYYDFLFFLYKGRANPGFKRLKCFPCKGTGMFGLRSGRKVTCRKCEGRGHFFVKCRTCNGTGWVIQKSEVITKICYHCNGVGKIKLNPFNPVITKGSILK